jgi:hypothetical protein
VTIENARQTVVGRSKISESLSKGRKVLLPDFEPIELSCKFEVQKIDGGMIDIAYSVGWKAKNVHQINKSARKRHSTEHYQETNICRKMLSPVPATCPLSSAEN